MPRLLSPRIAAIARRSGAAAARSRPQALAAGTPAISLPRWSRSSAPTGC
jgi:hypothetical protein